VTVAQGWDGTISGTINRNAVDAGANGVEVTTADNSQTDSAAFSVTVTPTVVPPTGRRTLVVST